MKTILIFGGSGFIGSRLATELKDDYQLVIFSRNPDKAKHKLAGIEYQAYNPQNPEPLVPWFEKALGVINLAGKNIGEKSWSKQFMDEILQSRLEMGNLIKEAFNKAIKKPSFFIQSSATHFYGIEPTDEKITEEWVGKNDCFLTDVSLKSEENVSSLAKQTRLVFIRTGIVLDKNKGALSKMAIPAKFFVGGPLGNGEQWVPWIHIQDEIRAIRFVIENDKLKGGVNLTAPHPVKQKDFAKAIGKQFRRPAFLPAPAFMLRLILGKTRADNLLLSGLRVVPSKLIKAGFSFKFETLQKALAEIYR